MIITTSPPKSRLSLSYGIEIGEAAYPGRISSFQNFHRDFLEDDKKRTIKISVGYVSPAQRHTGEDHAILAARHACTAKRANATRRAGLATRGTGRPSAP